ncbi:MAG: hypothetical protein MAG795_00697 [Candidatus Woesearchaeota archaeon]|nr:hypothetical protein [Candidatus Woesearchaeota archaeon]
MQEELVQETMVHGTDFDLDRFEQANSEVERHVMHGASESSTIRAEVDELNQETIQTAAEQRTESPIVQWFLKTYWTLTNTDAVQLTKKLSKDIEGVLKQSKKDLSSIVTDINRSRREEEKHLEDLGDLAQTHRTFKYAKQGYRQQIDEIDSLVAARSNGGNTQSLELKTLPEKFYEFSLRELKRTRGEIETKMMTTDIELQSIYSDIRIIGGQIKAAEKTTLRHISQYNQALSNRNRTLEHHIKVYEPQYVKLIERQAKIAETEEQSEIVINQYLKVCESLVKGVDERRHLLLSSYQAQFDDTRDAERARKSIDKAFDTQIENGRIGGEKLQSDAEAVMNQYL